MLIWQNKLSGFLFRINLNDKYFWVYQHIYSVSRIDRSKNVIALFVGDTYDEIDSDIVQIDSRADVIIFSFAVSNSGGDGQFLYAHSIFSISVP